MTLSEAKKIAKDILGIDVAFPHRNVWVFYSEDQGDLIITKDGAHVNRAGVFRCTPENDSLIDTSSGELVLAEDVFGKTFFEDDPSLFVDHTTSDTMDLEEKIDALLARTQDLLQKTNTPLAAMIMLDDLIMDGDEASYRRLIVLNNYLSTCGKEITMEEFTYLHHELYTLE